MPSIKNESNRFCQVLEAGILSEIRYAAKPARNGNPARVGRAQLGFSDQDVAALRRTCSAAYVELRRPIEDSADMLVDFAVALRPHHYVSRQNINRARNMVIAAHNTYLITPPQIYQALDEMHRFESFQPFMDANHEERRFSLLLMLALHAQTGALTQAAAAEEWVDRMFELPLSHFMGYLKSCAKTTALDAVICGATLSWAAAATYSVYSLATAPIRSREDAMRAAQALPAVPMLAASGLSALYIGVPLAVGVLAQTWRMAGEVGNVPRAMFYRDALLMRCITDRETCLVVAHPAEDRASFKDVRRTPDSMILGLEILAKAAGFADA